MLNFLMLLRVLLVGGLLATAAPAEDSGLAASPSAFVRAQAASGVHWNPWTDATLAAARTANKSVYVFIGAPLSDLTRATISQTFTSAKTVAWVNENFFCIFVDADERPDLAAYAQHYIRSIKQLQGSPVHLWLTPELSPYDGANYLPPSEEWGKPGFLKAARSALDTWSVDPARARALAKEAIGLLQVPPLGNPSRVPPADKLKAAAGVWVAAVDAVHGGFGTAPKQPEPELIRFLLARDDAAGRDAAINAARALVKGAAHDATDGGFFRRTIDEEWKEPYFQKTLADQARIALALFDAADAAHDSALRQAAVGALNFVLRDLKNPDGSLAAALAGTLEENPDPAKRPAFVRVGLASTGAQGLLVAALQRSGDPKLTAAAAALAAPLRGPRLPHLPGGSVVGTAADHAAVALALRALQDDATAARLLATANELYFDAATGAYQATPAALPPGFAVRVPANGDTPSAEVLALLAGLNGEPAALIHRSLMATIEYDEQPAGDVLLGLAQGK